MSNKGILDKYKDINYPDIKALLFTEKVDKGLKTEIINTLKDIRSLERVIATTNKDSLRRLAIDERGLNLDMLEKICKENGFDYKDFYEKYEAKNELD